MLSNINKSIFMRETRLASLGSLVFGYDDETSVYGAYFQLSDVDLEGMPQIMRFDIIYRNSVRCDYNFSDRCSDTSMRYCGTYICTNCHDFYKRSILISQREYHYYLRLSYEHRFILGFTKDDKYFISLRKRDLNGSTRKYLVKITKKTLNGTNELSGERREYMKRRYGLCLMMFARNELVLDIIRIIAAIVIGN